MNDAKKTPLWAGKVAQRVKALTARSDNLSSISGASIVEES